jgi:hypothetical protein
MEQLGEQMQFLDVQVILSLLSTLYVKSASAAEHCVNVGKNNSCIRQFSSNAEN